MKFEDIRVFVGDIEIKPMDLDDTTRPDEVDEIISVVPCDYTFILQKLGERWETP